MISQQEWLELKEKERFGMIVDLQARLNRLERKFEKLQELLEVVF